MTASWPIRFVSISARKSSTGIVSTAPVTGIPALLTSASRPPLEVTCSRAAAIDSAEVTSSSITSTGAPNVASAGERTPANTCQPSRARCVAVL